MSDPSLNQEHAERRLEAPVSPLWMLQGMDLPQGLREGPQKVLELEVIGVPRPQGSKRHVGRGILVEASTELKPWRNSITAHAICAGIDRIEGAVWVELMFRFDRPKTHYGKRGLRSSAPLFKITKPDTDKLSRAVLDGLLPVWRDDSQVVGLMAQKRWCRGNEAPGVVIGVWR